MGGRKYTTTAHRDGAPVCSFKGMYGWAISGRTLVLKPIADMKCPVRETFFGGRWKR